MQEEYIGQCKQTKTNIIQLHKNRTEDGQRHKYELDRVTCRLTWYRMPIISGRECWGLDQWKRMSRIWCKAIVNTNHTNLQVLATCVELVFRLTMSRNYWCTWCKGDVLKLIVVSWVLYHPIAWLCISSSFTKLSVGEILTIIWFLQILDYAEQSKQSSNNELTSLNEKMKEYKQQIDQQSRQSVNGSYEPPGLDCSPPFSKSTDKTIEEVMQSSANGKVFL